VEGGEIRNLGKRNWAGKEADWVEGNEKDWAETSEQINEKRGSSKGVRGLCSPQNMFAL